MPLRWGILGGSRISKDFILAMKTLPVGENQAVAVASSSETRAKSFAKENDIKKWYGSYEALVKDPDVDVVYVAGLTNTHAEQCKLALNNGKNVLCEKAFAMNMRETKEVLELAKEKKLFIMEAMWTRFLPIYGYFKKQLEEKTIGEVQIAQACFGLQMDHVPRISDSKLGGSALLDVGVYTLTFADIVFSGERPDRIEVSGHLFDSGVDHSGNISLMYSDKRMAQLLFSAGVNLRNAASVIGTNGTITLNPPFHAPTTITCLNEVKDFPLPDTEKPTEFINSSGLRYQIDAVRKSILSKELENKLMPHSTIIRIMEYMDEIRHQLGARFEQDNK